jgi:tetratricopeptide (TPR) repeat protein
MKQMKTIGLCVIAKGGPDDQLLHLLTTLTPHFDQVYLQVNATKEGIGYWSNKVKGINVSYFKWNDNFADARNALLAEVKTDYWLWADSDDEIYGLEDLRKVVDQMERNDTAIMFAPYHYLVNEDGITIELQSRERIIRTGTPGEWRGAVHETFIPAGAANFDDTTLIHWKHVKTPEDHALSLHRNVAILSREFNKEDKDPRIAYYLGLALGQLGSFEPAIEAFNYLIEHGGWDEERYRAWLQIAGIYQQMSEFPKAIEACFGALAELPDWPDAYYLLQQAYYEMDDHERSLEWFKIGQTKPEPDTDSARNPIVTQYQPMLLASMSYLFTGQVKEAMQTATRLSQLAPAYKELDKLKPELLRAYNEQTAIDNAKALIDFTRTYEGDPIKVLDSLPAYLRSDIRLTEERRKLTPAKTWPKGSVAYYCGQSFEPWGPDTLEQGMGGSEEAVVYLSRQLAKVGTQVVVYNERTAHLNENPLLDYLPWTEINPADTFDTFIAWRDPSMLSTIKARLKLCDLHDIVNPELVYRNAQFVDKFMFKSQFHRDLYPKLPDDKCVIIGNGINKGDFK